MKKYIFETIHRKVVFPLTYASCQVSVTKMVKQVTLNVLLNNKHLPFNLLIKINRPLGKKKDVVLSVG